MIRLLAASAIGLAAGTAWGQSYNYPRVWCFNPPLHSSPDLDQYRPIIRYNTLYGLHNPTTNPGYATVAAAEIFDAITTENGNGHPDNAVLFFHLGTSGIPYYAGTGTCVTALYAHASDAIQGAGSPPSVAFTWTPWKDAGIAATQSWFEDFVEEYKDLQTNDPGTPRPTRFFFDDEVPIIGDYATRAQIYAYWQLLKNDDRFDENSNVLVPGTGSNLYDLWDAAGQPELSNSDPSPWNYKYRWGSSGNQAWWNWWSGVCKAAVAGAMDEAIYSVVRAEWTTTPDPGFGGTGVVPLCSDYDGSLRLDTATNSEFGSRMSNGYMRKDSFGALNGGIGERIVWDAPGSNVVQSPSIYAGISWYHLGYYNPALSNPDPEVEIFGSYPGSPFTPGANSDDDWDSYLGSAPQECWSTVSLRNNRFNLDAMHRSANGRTTPIVPWVPMANEMVLVDGMETKYDFRGIDYDSGGVPVNTSARHLTRILAQCRARGVNELIEWNWGTLSPYPFLSHFNWGPDSQYAQNWEYFNEAVNNVWGYEIYSTYIDSGATALVEPPYGHPQYGAPVADLVRESDRDYGNTYTGRVRVDSLTGSVGTWFVVTFARDSGLGAPPNDGASYLEIDIEGIADVDADCYLYIRGPATGWTLITDGGTTDHWGSSIRNSPFKMPADRTARIHARIPYDADYFDGGPCHLALHIKPHSLTGTVSVWTDLVQLYGVHDVKRPAGDVDGNYLVNGADAFMVDDLIDNSGNRIKPTDIAVADMNGDGVIDAYDYSFYTAASADYADPVDDDYMSSFEPLR